MSWSSSALAPFRRTVCSRRWLGVSLFSTTLLLMPSHVAGRGLQEQFAGDASPKGVQPATYRNTVPGVAYLGSQSCAPCHESIYKSYMRTRMAHSMSLPGQSARVEMPPLPVTIFVKELNQYFQVFQRGPELYQSIYELDSGGKEVFRHTEKVEFVMGTGENGVGYIVRKGNYLFQAPLAFYPKARNFGLSPGYEYYDFGFSRLITDACIACHSGRPQPVAERIGLYRDPPVRELAIGCENCHGPGQLHVEERVRGDAIPEKGDRSIVNPAKLPTWLAVNICMSCHQDGDARVLKPGKDYPDFRPGTPLDDVVVILRPPPDHNRSSKMGLLDRYSEMTLSECYLKSGGRLGCLSCHDPHIEPPPEERAAYFRNSCFACHTDKSCKLSLRKRRHGDPPDDCAGCHMLKQDVQIPHTDVTDHRIVARSGEPFPQETFHRITPQLPDLIHVDAVPGAENVPIPSLTLLQAYRKILRDDPNPIYKERYSVLVDQLAKTESNDPIVLSALAQKESENGTPEGRNRAIHDLERAIELGSTVPDDYLMLADLLERSARVTDSVNLLQKAISQDPYESVYYRALARRCLRYARFQDVVDITTEGLQLFPEDSLLRKAQTFALKTLAGLKELR